MIVRRVSSVTTLIIAAAALLGACSKQTVAVEVPPPPQPAPAEQPVLMGAPTDGASLASARQAEEDAYVAALPSGLITTHRTGADGRVILVVSNAPIANPSWRSGPYRGARHHYHLNGGPRSRSVTTASAGTSEVAVNSQTPPNPTGAMANPIIPTAKPAPTATVAAAAPAPVAPVDKPATHTAGITLSPGMWLIGGLVLLAIVVLILLAGRKPKRRGYERESVKHDFTPAPEPARHDPAPDPDHTPDPAHA
jgi:hypothetical protein